MCSMQPQPMAEFGKAIDDLAAEVLAADASAGTGGLASAADPGQAVARLAQLWARLAELDPELAKRLPRYQA